MYKRANPEQMGIDAFFLPFGGKLDKSNRWVKLARMMPWQHIEEIYVESLDENTGRPSLPARIAFGAIFIKETENLTDAGTVRAVQENPYMQYFLGLHEFEMKPLFDASMMVHFRKRFPVGEVEKINEFICTGKWPENLRNVDRNDEGNAKSDESPEQEEKQEGNPEEKQKELKNEGTLILDATVAPADIKYPTDIDILNKAREHLETAIGICWKHVPHKGHKLPYSAKTARKSYLKLVKNKKWTEETCRKVIGEQLGYVELAMKRLKKLEALFPDYEDYYPSWLKSRLDVIPRAYAQQKEMYDKKIHVCEDRIVSLSQPHVRPVVRGKRPVPTEFGQKLHVSVFRGFTFLEQTCWNSFNESLDLIPSVEAYRVRHGCYPRAVLADRIYQTRENKKYCRTHHIRLSGPPLGRRKESDTDAKLRRQTYRDSCDRNAVEGRFGNCKRRFGLDLIMSKLDETAKTEAALNIMAMNAAYRLALWLCRFLYFVLFRLFQQTPNRHARRGSYP